MSQKGNVRALVEEKKNEPTQLALVMRQEEGQVEGKSLRTLKCFHQLVESTPPPLAVILSHVHLPTTESRPVGGMVTIVLE